ncbi:hypothetical protein FZEAL_7470 [Fusarium zealandicum]|uniref:Uncharacterized protein n=1 Tax=Fusarium zealandicum TaxID=1053134 RepID=A0A8H4XHU5_9HYPO|nr:hypothetical protein FZEAL_7470 [Fusarium zealandicum]
MIAAQPDLVQVSVSRSAEERLVVPAYRSSLARRADELKKFRERVVADTKGVGNEFDFFDRLSPHAMGISEPMLARLERLHLLLGRVLIDVVNRWFSDEDAGLPQRMPLDPAEEELLKWVIGAEHMPDYTEHLGCWRSDILFGRSSDGLDDQAPFLCEINGRLPLNGIMACGQHSKAITRLGANKDGLAPLVSFEESYNHITDFFDTSKPLFCVREKWHAIDSRLLLPAYTERTNQPTAVVRPSDLEIRPDSSSPSGVSLWDRSKNILMEQWVAEMLQDEWAALDPAVAHQLALTPLNDIRTILLVHDKRLLGILPDELPGMVTRGVLTAEEADVVAAGIAKTLIPGSKELQALLRESAADPTIKDNYIYKNCRDGLGQGIDLGRNLTQQEWLARLERLADPDVIRPHQDAAVIQRLVDHHWYDVVRHEVPSHTGPEPEKFHLIGSMYMFQSRQFYLGPWRLGMETHLGLSPSDAGIAMSAVRLPNWEVCNEMEK